MVNWILDGDFHFKITGIMSSKLYVGILTNHPHYLLSLCSFLRLSRTSWRRWA